MNSKFRSIAATLFLVASLGGIALAANTTFFTSIGDLVFPFTAPLRDGTAGTIDNMIIGATTPAAGSFTTIAGSSSLTGPIIAPSITGNDSSLGIAGQAAAQGGDVSTVGGTSSTSANAGGAVISIGGTPGATGVGGAVTNTGGAAVSGAGGVSTLVGGAGGLAGAGGAALVTGGLGGATDAVGGAATVTAGAGQGAGNGAVASLIGGASGAGATGAGGVSRVIGGAAASTNGAGGAASVTGGAGIGTGNGGAASLVGGAAGAAGVGGAVAVTAGSPTAGVGSNVVITASAGVGSTNAGGAVNLVPGAAAGAGAPGTIQINGNNNLMCTTFYTLGAPAAATDTAFYVATRPLLVVSASEVHAVASGGASKLQVVKDTGTDAPGAGTDLLTNNTNVGFDLAATANTVQVGTLTATVATKTLAAGDRLSVDFANAIQSSSGIAVTVCMAPL